MVFRGFRRTWRKRFPPEDGPHLVPRFMLSDHLPVTDVELWHARRPTMDDVTVLGTRIEDLM